MKIGNYEQVSKVSCLFTFLMTDSNSKQYQLFVYIENISCLFTFQMLALCLHFEYQLFVYISNVSCLFTIQMSAVCLHL